MFYKYKANGNNDKNERVQFFFIELPLNYYQYINLLEICLLWIEKQVHVHDLHLILYNWSTIWWYLTHYNIIILCGKLPKSKVASNGWFCLMCLVCLKGQKHGGKNLQNIKEKWKERIL